MNRKVLIARLSTVATRMTMGIGLLLVSLSACHTGQAQDMDFLKRSELLLSAGGMNYIGDLNNQSVFGTLHTAASFGLRSRLDNRWAFRFEFAAGRISSEDYLEWRNLSFRSDIYEASALAEINFWNFGTGATDRPYVFYLFGGITAFRYNPMGSYTSADGTEEWVALQPLRTEGQGSLEYPDRRPYQLMQLALPFGVGFKARINKHLSFSLEYGFRKTWTDYLDDVSTTYVGSDVIMANSADGDLAVRMADRSEVPNDAGIKRGDDSLDDWYAYMHFSLGVNLETILGWTRSKRCKL